MARLPRAARGGLLYHVLNRANARLRLFEREDDYATFDRTLAEALTRSRMRLLAYCLMPDHWHLVLWPRRDGDLSDFLRWLSLTHTRRWHARRGTAGQGHLYQGRYRSFPVQAGAPLLAVCRYVERNPVRAGLVARAQDWRWSSLGRRPRRDGGAEIELASGPVERPAGWTRRVNAAPDPAEEEALRQCIARGRPYGDPAWQAATARRLGLESSFRPRGRPRKTEKGS